MAKFYFYICIRRTLPPQFPCLPLTSTPLPHHITRPHTHLETLVLLIFQEIGWSTEDGLPSQFDLVQGTDKASFSNDLVSVQPEVELKGMCLCCLTRPRTRPFLTRWWANADQDSGVKGGKGHCLAMNNDASSHSIMGREILIQMNNNCKLLRSF